MDGHEKPEVLTREYIHKRYEESVSDNNKLAMEGWAIADSIMEGNILKLQSRANDKAHKHDSEHYC